MSKEIFNVQNKQKTNLYFKTIYRKEMVRAIEMTMEYRDPTRINVLTNNIRTCLKINIKYYVTAKKRFFYSWNS